MKNSNKTKAIYDSEQLIEWGGFLNEFLWVCAGANRKVLRQCPTDYAKYAGIGGTILFTALMAMLSGGYALYTVFNDYRTAILFGIFWGLLIFNLDRFIVNTMYSDGKVTISWKEFTSGLPRIVMAIFLGIVISTPLELRIYESEIDVRIAEDAAKKIKDYRAQDEHRMDSLQNVIFELRDKADPLPEAIGLSGQAAGMQTQLVNKMSSLSAVRQNITNLLRQRAKISTKNKKYNNLTYLINKKYAERNNLNTQVKQLQGQLAAVSIEYKDAIAKAQRQKEELVSSIQKQVDEARKRLEDSKSYEILINKEYGGFEARMKAFQEMRDDNTSTNRSAWCIMLLFIIIETAPTFFKMMIASGPYDDLLRAEMHRVKVLSDKRVSDINDEINTEVKISVQKNMERLEAEKIANKKIMEQIANVQAELLETAIEEWRKEELVKIKANPSEYINNEQKKQ